jgi:predicted enzyme related to lactoylglutathione lyase
MLQKLRTVIYKVGDLQKAKEWYTALAGVAPYFDEPFYAGFNIGGSELGLDPDMENTIPGNQSTAYWAVADIRAAVEKTLSLGGKLASPVTSVGGTIEVAIVADPFGNFIGLISGA